MTIAALQRHDRRLAQLRSRPRLSDGEIAEMHRIERARDSLWHGLPRRIERLRHTLATLETYASDIGILRSDNAHG